MLLIFFTVLAGLAFATTALNELAHSRSYAPTQDLLKEHDLLDIVLVASVDGKLHALNRSSGHALWSMSSFPTTTSVSAPSSLSALVRSASSYDPEDDEEPETYLIEPQSGHIYVLRDPSSPLQRFPFSMPELVDLSPFTSTSMDGEQTRVFVGRKETSLLLIELETGKIKATLTSECPPVFDSDKALEKDDDEYDEDEDDKTQISVPTEVYIGRTDYHISIYKKPVLNHPAPPFQNLSFSTYGPNNKDNPLQSIYRRTKDDSYLQSLPNGEVISFRMIRSEDSNRASTNRGGEPIWGHSFSAPIVAIFDVLRPHSSTSHTHLHSFVLLQPRLLLSDLFPNRAFPPSHSSANSNPEAKQNHFLPNMDSAYVGLLEETGSLFVMSPEKYPLVVFGTGAGGKGITKQESGEDDEKMLDASGGGDGGGGDEEQHAPPDSANFIDSNLNVCLTLDSHTHSARCLIGIRRIEEEDRYASEGRLKRLLDGPKTQGMRLEQGHGGEYAPGEGVIVIGSARPEESTILGSEKRYRHRFFNEQSHGLWTWWKLSWFGSIGLLGHWDEEKRGEGRGFTLFEALVPALGVGAAWGWVVWNKIRRSRFGLVKSQGREGEREEMLRTSVNAIGNGEGNAEQAASSTSNGDVDKLRDGPLPPTWPVLSSLNVNKALDRVELYVKPLPDPPSGLVDDGCVENDSPILVPDSRPTPGLVVGVGVEDGEDTEGEGDVDVPATPGPAAGVGKKRARRGKRGKKKKPVISGVGEINGAVGKGEEKGEIRDDRDERPLVVSKSGRQFVKAEQQQQSALVLSDTILGYGSHGTVVFQGTLQGRPVAIKRLLRSFVSLATREISLLQESDDHPNVIRYFYEEQQGEFWYIALELCVGSLADVVEGGGWAGGDAGAGEEKKEKLERWREICVAFEPKKTLRQISSGLRHLHGLKIVHRDIKPQNILISSVRSPSSSTSDTFGKGGSGAGRYKMLISDFGLCKKLDVDETSFLPSVRGVWAAGTVGWRAPEILRGEVEVEVGVDEVTAAESSGSVSSRGSDATVLNDSSSSSNNNNNKSQPRLTRSVDIFSLGCLFYYVLTNGGHPYGDRYEREVNILKDTKDLGGVDDERFGEEGVEARDLIGRMVDMQPRRRPDTLTCLLHPYFWNPGRRLHFLQDASDRFEIMCRDPKDPVLLVLEKDAQSVVGHDWHTRLDRVFVENLGKYRKYDGRCVQDLLRALRNKKHHYQDLPDNVKRHLGPMPDGFLSYFTKRFPKLFLHVHTVIKETGLYTESMFRSYFELPDS